MTRISGIHHITAITASAQANVDFYTGILGQKLVKKTVNFDDPGTYHLYYGDKSGNPGTILTYFPFAHAARGAPGPGMASAFAYAIPATDFDAMAERLRANGQTVIELPDRFGARVMGLRDSDGAQVELVEDAAANDAHGFHSVTMWARDPDKTIRILTEGFGYSHAGEEVANGFDRHRLVAQGAERGRIVDIIRSHAPVAGRNGAGSIHHVAFRAKTNEEQLEWIDRMAALGHRTTPVIDRNYFNAIYFREPNGILFEIATDPPGFAVDEDPATLGQALKLPAQYEPIRARIEAVLPPLKLPQTKETA